MSLSFNPTTSPLFLKLGKIIHAGKTLDVARSTTVPTEVEDVLDQYATGSIELQSIPDGLEAATNDFRSSGDATMLALREVFQDTIIRYVQEDEQQPSDTLEDAIAELVRQMEETNTYVEYGSITPAVAEVGSPTGDGALIIASYYDEYNRFQSFAYDEVISIECVDDRTKSAETLRFRGQPSVSKFAHNWPQGSGCDVSLSVVSPTDRRNLVANGSFETDDDDDATLPDGWLKGEGTAAALVTLPVAEVQTLTTTGTPTGGSYYITWSHGTITQYTDPLPYNAGQATVQAALRALTGLEAVTVVTTGTTPNWTHTITFTGVSRPEQLTVVDDALTGGTTPAVTPATTTAGDYAHFGGRAIKFTSDGASTGGILYQRLTGLQPNTVYALSVSHLIPVSAAAGVVSVSLVNEIGVSDTTSAESAVVAQHDADPASETVLTISYSEMNTTWGVKTKFFVTPTILPDIIYLKIRVSTAFTNTRVVYLDAIRLVPATQLYDGGPFVAAFAGSPPTSNTYADERFRLGDKYTLTITNAYGAEFQQWFNRFCDLDASGAKLPSDPYNGVAAAVNEVQTLTATGTVSSGQYKIEFDGQTTADIAYDANNATILAALELLSNIASGDVTLGGGTLPGTPVTFTFGGTYAGRNVALMTIVAGTSPLGGGGSYGITLTTAGVGYISDSVFIT